MNSGRGAGWCSRGNALLVPRSLRRAGRVHRGPELPHCRGPRLSPAALRAPAFVLERALFSTTGPGGCGCTGARSGSGSAWTARPSSAHVRSLAAAGWWSCWSPGAAPHTRRPRARMHRPSGRRPLTLWPLAFQLPAGPLAAGRFAKWRRARGAGFGAVGIARKQSGHVGRWRAPESWGETRGKCPRAKPPRPGRGHGGTVCWLLEPLARMVPSAAGAH